MKMSAFRFRPTVLLEESTGNLFLTTDTDHISEIDFLGEEEIWELFPELCNVNISKKEDSEGCPGGKKRRRHESRAMAARVKKARRSSSCGCALGRLVLEENDSGVLMVGCAPEISSYGSQIHRENVASRSNFPDHWVDGGDLKQYLSPESIAVLDTSGLMSCSSNSLDLENLGCGFLELHCGDKGKLEHCISPDFSKLRRVKCLEGC